MNAIIIGNTDTATVKYVAPIFELISLDAFIDAIITGKVNFWTK